MVSQLGQLLEEITDESSSRPWHNPGRCRDVKGLGYTAEQLARQIIDVLMGCKELALVNAVSPPYSLTAYAVCSLRTGLMPSFPTNHRLEEPETGELPTRWFNSAVAPFARGRPER